MWLVFALWCCESGYDPQASVFTGKHPPTPEHKLIAPVRALGKHLESNRSPPLSLLEVAVHEQHDHMNSFSRLLPAKDDKKGGSLLQFCWAEKQSEHAEERGKSLPCLTSADVPM